MHESSEEFEIQPDLLLTAELAALECLKNPHRLVMGKNGVATFSRLFLIGSISYLQVMIDDIHEILDVFDIWPDPTTGFHGNR